MFLHAFYMETRVCRIFHYICLTWRSEFVTPAHALYIEKLVMSMCKVEGLPIQVGFE